MTGYIIIGQKNDLAWTVFNDRTGVTVFTENEDEAVRICAELRKQFPDNAYTPNYVDIRA